MIAYRGGISETLDADTLDEAFERCATRLAAEAG